MLCVCDDKAIKNIITMHEGDNLLGFFNIEIFYSLMQPLINKHKETIMNCLLEVQSYLENLTCIIIERAFHKFS